MLRKVRVDQVVVGMFLHGVEGSWLANPFWRSGFLLSEARQVGMLHGSKVREIWIDTDKGLDLPEDVPSSGGPPEDAPPAEPAEAVAGSGQVPIADELENAARVCLQARQAVTSMFQEARMGRAVDMEGAQRLVEEISYSVSRSASAVISLARLKTADTYTFMHSVAVCAMMMALGRELGLDDKQVRSAGLAGLLHDLGKAMVPAEVLNKPGALSATELAVVRRHPQLGYNLLRKAPDVDPAALDVCLHHHEKMNGSGYPEKLQGEAISLFARMGAVCDVYDAITSNRPYKAGWDPAESMRVMGQWVGEHFDAQVFQAFSRSLGIYPVGSLVRMGSGMLGVVVEQTPDAPTAPRVKVFYSTRTQQRVTPEVVDLSLPGTTELIAGREDPLRWKFPDLNELWSGLKGFD
jgi:putative nucleotidyltransferase with HDIG domain